MTNSYLIRCKVTTLTPPKELQDLAGKLDELDSSVCGTEEAGSCEPCGGSACGSCGGDGCGGAVGIVNQITGLAQVCNAL